MMLIVTLNFIDNHYRRSGIGIIRLIIKNKFIIIILGIAYILLTNTIVSSTDNEVKFGDIENSWYITDLPSDSILNKEYGLSIVDIEKLNKAVYEHNNKYIGFKEGGYDIVKIKKVNRNDEDINILKNKTNSLDVQIIRNTKTIRYNGKVDKEIRNNSVVYIIEDKEFEANQESEYIIDNCTMELEITYAETGLDLKRSKVIKDYKFERLW